jgi:hypothetical protein
VTQEEHLTRPVSAVLEADLRAQTRRHGVVVWLDLDGHYTGFVDRLIEERRPGALPYAVHAYRGSFLELLLALEHVASGSERPQLLLHLPGFTEASVRGTPLLELYEAGSRYRKALPTLVTDAAAGRITPEQISVFSDQPDLTLNAADAWLSGLLRSDVDSFGEQVRGMTPGAVLDDLLANGFIASRLRSPSNADAIWQALSTSTGLPTAWRDTAMPPGTPAPQDAAFALASWALAVEYARDLQRAPIHRTLTLARELPNSVAAACHELAAHLRERHPETYQRIADETEALLSDEVAAATASDLGKVITFRFEEDLALHAALDALTRPAYHDANAWAEQRIAAGDASVWLRDDPHRRSAWQLVHAATRLHLAIAAAGERLAPQPSLEAALEAYVQRGAPVDQAQRHLEQHRSALLYPLLPSFETLRARLDDARTAWHAWAERWARDFDDLCRQHGFLPSAPHQQRTLFDDVVVPATRERGTTALFLIDALRYEMADELHHQLAPTPATTIHLRARLAELPSVTEIGMNALAPVARNGRLHPALTPEGDRLLGFNSGEFRVFDPETRKRAMHERVGGATCPWLSLTDVTARDASSLKRTAAQARLLIVHDREIDTIGERGAGARVFDSVLRNIRAAWRLLREAGVQRFIITSDHGFLPLHDPLTTRHAYGRRADPQPRYTLTSTPADSSDTIRVPLADLGYDHTNAHAIFPTGIGVFDTGRPTSNFVHGGNSLQERVIPVLTLTHRSTVGGSGISYDVSATAREGVAGLHCIEITIRPTGHQGALDFAGERSIELALRAPEHDDVHVELIQARGPARTQHGVIEATVGTAFEIFFRLTGPTDARALVEVYHPSAVASVNPALPDARFTVTAQRTAPTPEQAPTAPEPEPGDWLDSIHDAGARQVFEHLARHGVITEQEAASMLGGPRGLRRFANHFDQHAAKAPFTVRIDIIGGVKRYVREGTA